MTSHQRATFDSLPSSLVRRHRDAGLPVTRERGSECRSSAGCLRTMENSGARSAAASNASTARARRIRDVAIIAAALILVVTWSADSRAAGIGEPAPAFALPTASGETLALSRFAGKVVYVDFWASWCGPCRQSFPFMNELQQRYGPQGLAIVAINVDKMRADADRFLAQYPASFSVVFDPAGNAPAAYAVPGMPTSYLIDARGNIVHVESGFVDEHRADLEARIRAQLGR